MIRVYSLAGAAEFGSGCLFRTRHLAGQCDHRYGAFPWGAWARQDGRKCSETDGYEHQHRRAAVVRGGVLQADFGTGLSNLGNVTLNGGTLSSESGGLTQALGPDAGQINIVANSPALQRLRCPLAVNLGGAGEMLAWAARRSARIRCC